MALRVEYPGTTYAFTANDLTLRDIIQATSNRSGALLFRATIRTQDLPRSVEQHLTRYPASQRRTLPDGSPALEGLLLVEPGQIRLVDNPLRPTLEAVIPYGDISPIGLAMTLRRIDLTSFTATGAPEEKVVVHPIP